MKKPSLLHGLSMTAPAALAIAMLLPSMVSPAFADARTESTSAYQRAFSWFEKGDYRAANIELRNALKANPNNPLARLLQARVALQLGGGIAAQTEIEKAIAAGVPRDKTRHLMAHALLLQGQIDRALDEVKPNLVPPQFASYAARMRGRALSTRNPEQAKAEFELAQRLSPRDPDAAVDLARFYLVSRDPAGGERYVNQALALQPTHVGALLLKGDIVRATRGLSASLPYFSQAIEIDPNNIEALLERAATLGDLKREKEARADLKRVYGFVPDHPLALYLEAVIETRAGRFAQANALMTRTKGALNRYPPALLLQGMIAYQLNNIEQANDNLAKVVAQSPNSILARKLYSAAQLRKGDAAGAIDTLRPIISAGKADARTMALMGSALARQGKFDEAQKYLEKAADAEPEEAALRTQLAMTRIAQGDDAGASAELQQVLKNDKNSLQALMMVSLIDLRSGRYKQALTSANNIVKAYPQLPMGYNMRGAAQLGLNDSKGAEASFREALAKKPDYHEARRNLAQLLVATKRVDEGRRELQKVVDADPQNGRAMFGLSRIAAMQNKPEERINWLRRAAAANPKDIAARIELTQVYVQSRQPDRALSEATALERDFPKNRQVLQVVAGTQLAAGRVGEAETTFNKLVSLVPNDANARLMLARTQLAGKKVDAARDTLQRALTLPNQNLVPVYVELIALESRAKRYDRAVAQANKLRQAYPKLNAADRALGATYFASGDLPKAAAAFEAARRLRFDKPTATQLAATYMAMRQPNKALAVLRDYRKANPRDPSIPLQIADIYLQTKTYKPAITIYEQLNKIARGRDVAVLNNLAWAYQQLGDKRAVATAAQAHKLAPKAPAVLDTYGWVLVEKRQDPKRGLALLQQAVKAAPNNPQMRYHLAVAYRMNGKPQEAMRELQTALETPKFDDAPQARQMLAQLRTGR